ncbi:hypothetical protein PHLCEN_2v5138 [Hermanssonia centrifuga]|uniref:Uncharacterized protein n=1 Tax=Hermanssonia centrifuga TaxID=98765 RepID=A0A2R6PBQ4_9APHY|nr:hypothetical protein PHLCEN_2v5138 [Hermanssonia centrifuga]
MSGDWAWTQADLIARDIDSHGAMFCPFILGSDKTTVSVATGQNDYYPLYMSLGNIWNNVRRAHCNAVIVIAFLAIPKTEKRYAKDPVFRKFRQQLFHSSLATILSPLKPDVVRCPDGHFRRAIYGLGPYIANYIEQILATNTVQGWCVTCPTERESLEDQYEGPDLRSQEHTELLVQGLNLKALWDGYGVVGELIVYLPAVVSFVPPDMARALGCFMQFCYLVRRSIQTEDTLTQIKHCLKRYHALREIFRTTGTRPDGFSSFIRHHSIDHYPGHITNFGAPNRLCSSIMESKHIKAVKELWRRSSPRPDTSYELPH